MARSYVGGAIVAIMMLVACSSSSGSGKLQQSDAEALGDLLVADAQGSGISSTSLANLRPLGIDTSLRPDAACSPQHLTPPESCAFGGNIYTTINQSCPDANTATCCGNTPACANWKGDFSGQYKTLFNGCKTGTDTEADGTINATMTGSIQGDCGGLVQLYVQIRYNGSFDVRVDGVDACPDGISGTLTITAYANVEVALDMNICGFVVTRDVRSPCFVDCGGGACCPSGAYCGKAGNRCFPTSFPVDCGDSACPSGTSCASGGGCKAG